MDLNDLALSHVAEGERERVIQIGEAWKRYKGNAPEPLRVSRGVQGAVQRVFARVTPTGRPPVNDNIRVNYHRLIVDMGVWYLFGDELPISLDSARQRNEDEQWLDSAWPLERRMLQLLQLGINGGVTGHAFAKLMAPRPGSDPRIIVLDPTTVTPSYEPDDFESVWRWKIEWSAINREGKPRRYRQVIERADSGLVWEIIDYEGDPKGELAETGRETWTRPWSPVVAWQNLPAPNEFWGTSDLEPDIIEVGDRINRLLSNVNRIIRIHAHPKTVTTGMTPAQRREIETGPENMLHLPQGAEIQNLEMTTDLKAAIDFSRQVIDALHEISDIPAVATGKLDRTGQFSSLALKVMLAPLIAKTRTKRLTYGLGAKQIAAGMLALGKGREIESFAPILGWPEIVPTDPKSEAETLEVDRGNGLSEETYLEKRGYDPEQEQERRAAEATRPVPPSGPGNDGRLGGALLDAFDRGQQ